MQAVFVLSGDEVTHGETQSARRLRADRAKFSRVVEPRPGLYGVRRLETASPDGRGSERNTTEEIDTILPAAAKLSAGNLDLHT
jgi:hypothetical protein